MLLNKIYKMHIYVKYFVWCVNFFILSLPIAWHYIQVKLRHPIQNLIWANFNDNNNFEKKYI